MTALVAKLGGSLWRSPLLGEWIAALAAYPNELTIVPGGGPFADAVRAAQGPMGFSDSAAHEMALLAMEQYGFALCDLFPVLALASSVAEAAALRARGKIPVWRPWAMAQQSETPRSWDVTSDSLAAWYARQSGAARLLLIKSADPAEVDRVGGYVDAAFTLFSRDLEVFFAGPSSLAGAARIFSRGDVAGLSRPVQTPSIEGA